MYAEYFRREIDAICVDIDAVCAELDAWKLILVLWSLVNRSVLLMEIWKVCV